MVEVPFYWLDVFTSQPFKGNPAAVCIMRNDYEDSLYRKIAEEIGLIETAFTEKIDEKNYKLRWFTPCFEVELCGHATIATAYILKKEYGSLSPVSFHTLSGVLKAEVSGDKVTLNLPTYIYDKTDDERILDPFGIKNPVEIRYMPGLPTPAFFIILNEEDKVRRIKPDFPRLIEVSCELDVIGITVTAPGDKEYDYVFRHFAPRAGINEEQGTGSVHCILAPYWKEKFGKSKMRSIQYSARGSVMEVEVIEDKVMITGAVTPLINGTLSINLDP